MNKSKLTKHEAEILFSDFPDSEIEVSYAVLPVGYTRKELEARAVKAFSIKFK